MQTDLRKQRILDRAYILHEQQSKNEERTSENAASWDAKLKSMIIRACAPGSGLTKLELDEIVATVINPTPIVLELKQPADIGVKNVADSEPEDDQTSSTPDAESGLSGIVNGDDVGGGSHGEQWAGPLH